MLGNWSKAGLDSDMHTMGKQYWAEQGTTTGPSAVTGGPKLSQLKAW